MTVRHLGRFLPDVLDVPAVVVDYVAEQVGAADPSCRKQYVERATRFEHQAEIVTVYGYVSFATAQALPATGRTIVDPHRFAGLSAYDTRRVVYGTERRTVLTHSPQLHEHQARGFTGTTAAKAGRQLDELAATLARGATRRTRSQVEAGITRITRDSWVRRVITWQLEVEDRRELVLQAVGLGEHAAGLGSASGGGVDQHGFADAFELVQQLAHGQVQPGVFGLQAHQVRDLQGEDAGEHVDADVVFGPVEHRGERYDVRVFHLPEGGLGYGLGAVAGDHLGDGPVVVVGDEHVFAEDLVFQGGLRVLVDAPAQAQLGGLLPLSSTAGHPQLGHSCRQPQNPYQASKNSATQLDHRKLKLGSSWIPRNRLIDGRQPFGDDFEACTHFHRTTQGVIQFCLSHCAPPKGAVAHLVASSPNPVEVSELICEDSRDSSRESIISPALGSAETYCQQSSFGDLPSSIADKPETLIRVMCAKSRSRLKMNIGTGAVAGRAPPRMRPAQLTHRGLNLRQRLMRALRRTAGTIRQRT
jgi:Domain of unknown function (DUF4158)